MRRLRAVGSVKSPAGVDAFGEHRIQGPRPADHVQVPAQQVDPRKGQVLGPDHQRQTEIPQHGRRHRHQEKENHDYAVHREQAVVGISRDQGPLGRQQVQPHDGDCQAAQQTHRRDANQVVDGDPLVILGQQPRDDAIRDVEIVRPLGRRFDRLGGWRGQGGDRHGGSVRALSARSFCPRSRCCPVRWC